MENAGIEQLQATRPGRSASLTHRRGVPHHSAPSRRSHCAAAQAAQGVRRRWLFVGVIALSLPLILATLVVEMVR